MRYRCPWCSPNTIFETDSKTSFLGHAVMHPAVWELLLDAAAVAQKPDDESKKPEEAKNVKK